MPETGLWSLGLVLALSLGLGVAAARPQAQPHLQALAHLRPAADDSVQTQAVRELVLRLLGSRASDFLLSVHRWGAGQREWGAGLADRFVLRSLADGRVSVEANTAVAAATGLYRYLSSYCGCHISWSGQQLSLPPKLPSIPTPVTVTAPHRFRYYQNVCASSYSFVWWDWKRWEREIDWMALSGINLPLAFTGQETIWQRVYFALGLNQTDVDDFFAGPAFLAWSRMGNIHSWAGPLPTSWYEKQLNLQHQILQRMRSLGMLPVLPAFAGHVPGAVSRLFPTANISRLGSWGHLNCTYSCSYLLDPEDALFQRIGKMFLAEVIREFGSDHIYNADTFNEMVPSSSDPKYLSSVSSAVFKSMTQVDPEAIWLMQGWLFVNRPTFWLPEQIKALLHGVPLGKMILLDLFAESQPMYAKTQSFYGQPFIWCMLHNFGGNLGMYGTVESINKGPFEAMNFPNSTMVGTGLAPEGIEQNDVVYELMNEIAWHNNSINLNDWFTLYAQRRYGTKNRHAIAAWQLLLRSVYNCTVYMKNHNRSPLVRKPSLSLDTSLWYSKSDVYEAWSQMQAAASDLLTSETFKYDLIDVTRQSVQLLVSDFYEDLKVAFSNNALEELLTSGGVLVYDVLPELDSLLSSDRHFMLGPWLESARSLGANEKEADLYEFNARSQVTLWGPGGNLLDYANKEWGGLVNDYYTVRWDLFVSTLAECLNSGVPFRQHEFDQMAFRAEQGFLLNKKNYPDQPTGNTFEIAERLFRKYHPQVMKRLNLQSGRPQRSRG